MCTCETWLNDTVLNNELLPGYSVFRRDRIERNGHGGVLVAVRENTHTTHRKDLERNDVECLVVELRTECNKPTLLYTFYRPANCSPDVLHQLISSLQTTPESSCVILVDDFNLPSINWSLDEPTLTINGGQLEESFCDLVDDNFVQQFFTGPSIPEIIHFNYCYATLLKAYSMLQHHTLLNPTSR